MMEHMIKLDVLIDYIDWDDEVERWTLRCEPEDIPAVEVVHGRWIHDCVEGCNPFVDSLPIWVDVMKCSVCKEYIEGSHGTNYCPNCGADMRGTRND